MVHSVTRGGFYLQAEASQNLREPSACLFIARNKKKEKTLLEFIIDVLYM